MMAREYSLNEIARHCYVHDLWIIFDNKVYDMTAYLDSHPGGKAMLRQAGKDATIAMKLIQMHNIAWRTIEKKLQDHQIGIVER
ncbi:cytochrome b5-like Heme/Steroid binding domain protein [Dictyocaulus viviparus]|uniref:Cytochrome b5-like Heme/Steroid binding domain protein n=1 Tax=Dictyocaulus viviparus TaxID=29172 RepID=A0A0D8XF40_DICVI|nr:cytochrome b5-like Heme/Steroid binding domain protein [Dictyocaulus viviparus]